VKETFV